MRHLATIGMLTLAAYLLYRAFRAVDPGEILTAVQRISPAALGIAAAATVASYLVLSLFDWFALRHFEKKLPYPTVLLTSFIAYAFNFNLGTLVGAVAMRYRLYEKWGLAAGDVARITIYATSSSIVGYGLVAGAVFFAEAPAVPAAAHLPFASFRSLGVVIFLLALGYLTLCDMRRAPLRVGRWRYELPDLHGAGRQIGVACCEWVAFSGVLYPLMPTWQVSFSTVLGVHLVAAMAGALLHIPGGLGVLEGTFLVMLGDRLPRSVILGSLVAYRFIFYLLPLALAATAYVVVEAQTWSRARQTAQERA